MNHWGANMRRESDASRMLGGVLVAITAFFGVVGLITFIRWAIN